LKDIDDLCIDTARMLAVDMVERAGSGHPGFPLGAAPAAYAVYDGFLRFDPSEPGWFDRDRFVLSAGHGSALLYALLHVYGYDLPLEELRRFRQWGSMTPGHPEYGLTPGVECTTGPLGQGLAMAVGMAMAERHLAAMFNTPGIAVIDHRTFVLASDGDMMEGVASEAASLAGHLRLSKLVVVYDDNGISIEGDTDLSFTEDVPARFESYGWRVLSVEDGNDLGSVREALGRAVAPSDAPTLIRVRSRIGYGSPKENTAEVHGAPLGPDGVRETKKNLGWPQDAEFHIPEEAAAHFAGAGARGRKAREEWEARMEKYRETEPEKAKMLETMIEGKSPKGCRTGPRFFPAAEGPMATRSASGRIINDLAGRLPGLFGGSADLAPSNKTYIEGGGDFEAGSPEGRNIRFGVREHAMAAAVNGIAVHGGLIPFGATFLVFSDYARPALRISALMRSPSVFVFTHDSVGLGEDGPTHQPVEHLMSLRAIPGLSVFRPADANETAACWNIALEREGPSAIALMRQKVPVLDPDRFDTSEGPERGAYVLLDSPAAPDLVIAATGSEVHLALEAAGILEGERFGTRVVSIPCIELFEDQEEEYRRKVLPPGVPVLAVEAGVTLGWRRFAAGGAVLGLDRFGASAPGAEALSRLGFNAKNLVAKAKRVLEDR